MILQAVVAYPEGQTRELKIPKGPSSLVMGLRTPITDPDVYPGGLWGTDLELWVVGPKQR